MRTSLQGRGQADLRRRYAASSREDDQPIALDRTGARGLTRSGDREEGHERDAPLPTNSQNLVIFTALLDAVTVLDTDDGCNALRLVELLKGDFRRGYPSQCRKFVQ